MFLDTIPYPTKYGDRVVFIRSEDLDRLNILKGTPQFVGSDVMKKQFCLDMIAALGGDAASYKNYGQKSLWSQTQSVFLNQPHLGIIIKDAHLLFENRKQRTIVKLLYQFAGMAQFAKKQFLLVGNADLMGCTELVCNYQGKPIYDLSWLLARMKIIQNYSDCLEDRNEGSRDDLSQVVNQKSIDLSCTQELETTIARIYSLEDEDDDFDKPTDYAKNKAIELISEVVSIRSNNFFKAWASTDGSGYLRLTWSKLENKGKQISLLIPPTNLSNQRISLCRNHGEALTEFEYSVSAKTLIDWLDWLSS